MACVTNFIILLFGLFAFTLAHVGEAPSFSYENGAPNSWHLLDKSFGTCKNGRRQSPINVAVNYTSISQSHLPKVQLKLSVMEFEHDVHGLHLSCSEKFRSCGSIRYRGKKYNMAQIHFHSWSEHHINGRAYPLELHFVHKSKEGELAVFGVLFRVGKHNKVLGQILDGAARKHKYAVLDLVALSGASKLDVCLFPGSLTTPPCSEGVQWIVSLHMMDASLEQIGRYRELVGIGKNNNRPLQSANGRPLVCAAAAPEGWDENIFSSKDHHDKFDDY